MKRFWFLLALLVVASSFSGCTEKSAPSPKTASADEAVDPIQGHLLHAQAKLPTIRLWLGTEELATEVASRPVEISTGMMFRTNMPENTAMLFVFGNAMRRSFYMRNCVVPLSAAYMNPDGEITQIIDMKPRDETGIPSAADNIQFVLEVPQGWFTRHNISTGAVTRTEYGSLRETFFSRN